jgi:alpha-beta hydrolase superfamily lysophospholipase
MSTTLETGRFTAAGGLSLQQRRWSGERAERALVIVHGFAEHSARYDFAARWFAERGYRVHAFDQRGHGESEGPRNHTPRFDALLDDVERFLARVREEEGRRPLILLGHSMGGLEVACLLARRRPEVAAAVLSGPGLAPGEGISRSWLRAASLLSRVAPRLRLPSGLDAGGLARDPAVVAAYRADPLIHTFMTARLAAELRAAVGGVQEAAARIEVPVLIVHGEADPLCDVAGSRRFHGALESEGSSILTYPGLLHEVLNEPEREQVLADIRDWIEKRVAGEGAA